MNRFAAAVARNLTLGVPIACVVSIIFSAAASAQQNYPNRPVRLVSGYAPGGTTTLVGRLVDQKLSESWGQQFNRGKVNTITGKKRSPLLPAGTPVLIIDNLAAWNISTIDML